MCTEEINKLFKVFKFRSKSFLKKIEKISLLQVVQIITIISFLFAVFIYHRDSCQNHNDKVSEYLNQLESLYTELKVNQIQNNHLISGKAGYLDGGEVAVYRFFTGVTEKLVAEGKIKDKYIRNNLYNILEREQKINRILDGALITYHTTGVIDEQKTQNRIATRIIQDNQLVIEYSEELEKYLPETMKQLEIHFNETIKENNRILCKIE